MTRLCINSLHLQVHGSQYRHGFRFAHGTVSRSFPAVARFQSRGLLSCTPELHATPTTEVEAVVDSGPSGDTMDKMHLARWQFFSQWIA
jgi:hypothetical protein